VPIADVQFFESIPRIGVDVRQILGITRVREFVDVDDRLLGKTFELVANEIRADETAPARNDQAFHIAL
jgi:hypothetical protein